MKIKSLTGKYWIFGPVTGLVCAALSAILFTTIDWARNYAGIFRDSSGTNWSFVYETAVSWFVPTLIYVTVFASLGHLATSILLDTYRKRFPKNNKESNK